MSFQQIVSRSSVKKQELKQTIAQLESSASTAAAACAGLLVDDLNEEVKQVHDTQKLLERESQLLQQELTTLTSELTGWSGKTQELLEALKHVGDIEHYVAVLKREAAALDRVLGQLDPSDPQSPATAAAAAASTSQQQPASLAPAIGSQQEAAAASEAAAIVAGGSAAAAAEGSKQEGEEQVQHEQEEQQQRQGAPEDPSAGRVQLPVSSRASR